MCEMGVTDVLGIALHVFDYSYWKLELCGTRVGIILTVVYKMDFERFQSFSNSNKLPFIFNSVLLRVRSLTCFLIHTERAAPEARKGNTINSVLISGKK